jgi:hypothetical protein
MKKALASQEEAERISQPDKVIQKVSDLIAAVRRALAGNILSSPSSPASGQPFRGLARSCKLALVHLEIKHLPRLGFLPR